MTTEQRVCLNCRQPFEATVLMLQLGPTPKDFTRRYCFECAEALQAQHEQEETALLAAARAAVRRTWREKCGIPDNLQMEGFGTFEQARQQMAYDAALKFAEAFPATEHGPYPASLVLMGSVGTGKSHLAASIAHRIIDRWMGDPEQALCPVAFTTETAIMERLQASFQPEALEQKDSIIAELTKRRLLIVDDVGVYQARDKGFTQQIWGDIIDKRIGWGLPVVLTTNFDQAVLARHVHARVSSRLFEMTGGQFIALKGNDYRILKGEAKRGKR